MKAGTNWKFATAGDGKWRWMAAHTDGSEEASHGTFDSVEDCMADAAQRGYADYRPTEAAYA